MIYIKEDLKANPGSGHLVVCDLEMYFTSPNFVLSLVSDINNRIYLVGFFWNSNEIMNIKNLVWDFMHGKHVLNDSY